MDSPGLRQEVYEADYPDHPDNKARLRARHQLPPAPTTSIPGQLMQRANDRLNAIGHLMRYSMMALWSTVAGVAGLLRSSTSGIAKSDKIISSLKSSI
jgi:hypothetical protein